MSVIHKSAKHCFASRFLRINESFLLKNTYSISASRQKETPIDHEDTFEVYQRVTAAVERGVVPERHLLRKIIESCKTSLDLDRALSAMYLQRIALATKQHVLKDQSEEVCKEFVLACVRCGFPERGLISFNGGKFGLVPHLGAAHLLMNHALEKKNVSLARLAFLAVVKEPSLKPSRKTAELLLETCQQAGDLNKLVRFAKEAVDAGAPLPVLLAEDILEYCASQGRWKDGLLVANSLADPLSARATSAVAKCHVLAGDTSGAAMALTALKDAGEPDWEQAVEDVAQSDWISGLPVGKDGTTKGASVLELQQRLEELRPKLEALGWRSGGLAVGTTD